jgi:PAS domain S-box-containing protein
MIITVAFIASFWYWQLNVEKKHLADNSPSQQLLTEISILDKEISLILDSSDNNHEMLQQKWQSLKSLHEIQNMRDLAQKQLTEQNIKVHLSQMILLILAIMVMILFIASLISKNMKKNTNAFISFFQKAQSEDAQIDLSDIHYSDFLEIAASANQMIQERKFSIQNLQKRDKLMNGVSVACQLMISKSDFEKSIHSALNILCKAAEVNRVYIFQNSLENEIVYLHQVYESVVNTTSQLQNDTLLKLAYNDGYNRWFEILSRGEIICGMIKDFPEIEKPLLIEQNILSILVAPIFTDDYFWGFIGFDDCQIERIWNDAEKSILATMAATFGNAFSRQKTAYHLKESEELFRTLTEQLKSGVYTFDESGRFTYVNPEVIRITGYMKEELLAMNFYDIVHHDFRNLVKERGYSRLKGNDIPISYDFIIVTKSGEKRWVKISNSKITIHNQVCILGTATDITQLKDAEDALSKEKQQLAVTLRSIGDAVITTDLNGYVLLLNQMAELLAGWNQNEAKGRKLTEIFNIIDEYTNERLKNPVEIVLEQSKTVSLSNHTLLINKHNKKIFISASASPILDEKKQISGVVLVFRDVTKEKKAAQIQSVLLNIAIAVSTSENITVLFETIKQELSTIIPVNNFHIALFNEQLQINQLPYFVDEKNQLVSLPVHKSLDSKVIQQQTTLLVTEKEIHQRIEANDIDWYGTVPKIWLGVPLTIDNRTIGAIVVQDYQDENTFNENDAQILLFISKHIAMAIEKMQIEKTVKESEEKYRLLFETGNDAILLLDNDVCIDFNHKALQMFKCEKEYLIGKTIFALTCFESAKESDLHSLLNRHIDSAFDGEQQIFEWEMQDSKGKMFDSELCLNPFEWKNHWYLLAIIRDITEQKKREKHIVDSLTEKETLLQEIHHRVKNNMQVISSMLNLQSSMVDNLKFRQMFKDSQNRVKTMALVHEKLYRSNDFSNIDFEIYIKDLSIFLYKTYQMNPEQISLQLNIKDISFNINTAIPCGLIVNEFITNSFKYAFPENRKGLITITVIPLEKNHYRLEYSDDGIGLPDDIDLEGTKTLGLYLVNILTLQLNGTISIFRMKGTKFILTFERSL